MKKSTANVSKNNYKTIRDVIEDIAVRHNERIAYTFYDAPNSKEKKHKSFAELRSDVRALSTELIARGMRGKHCALVGKLSYRWICTYYALFSIGAVLVTLDRDWTAEELCETMKRADATEAFFDADLTEKADLVRKEMDIEPVLIDGDGENVYSLIEAGKERIFGGDNSYFETEIDPMALALLVFTSGTTGKGKGVMLNQNALIRDIAWNVVSNVDFTDKAIASLPPHHTYGSTINILAHDMIGVEMFISSGLRYIMKELKEEKPGHLVLVPLYLETFYRKITANIADKGKAKIFSLMMKVSKALRKVGIDLRRRLFRSVLDAFGGEVQFIVSGGAPISNDISEFFDAVGIEVLNGYGITECAPLIAVNHSGKAIAGSVGPVIDCDEVIIADPNENGEGEIRVKGPNVMMGYYKDEKATAAAFDEDGYFRTGDYGKLDKKGNLYITGRLKNLIILSNGKNVYPEEIEAELVAEPGVIDVVVYEGQSRRGLMYNTIVAEIYPDKEYLEKNGISDAQAHFEKIVNNYNRTAIAYKKIGIVRVRDGEFPKNTLRKIMRFKLDMTID
ncbi:MAG: AMP-binding protein [Clostridia bacterium]|nr:AMP-binding protein [Clostridia bacterium]